MWQNLKKSKIVNKNKKLKNSKCDKIEKNKYVTKTTNLNGTKI